MSLSLVSRPVQNGAEPADPRPIGVVSFLFRDFPSLLSRSRLSPALGVRSLLKALDLRGRISEDLADLVIAARMYYSSESIFCKNF